MSTPKPTPSAKPRKKAKGALSAIGALLLASAALRIATGANEALAREGGEDVATPVATSEPIMAKPDMAAAPKEAVSDEDISTLLGALRAREERVAKRERGIDIRMQALSAAEQEINRKLAALEQAEKKLKDTLALAQTAAEDDITKLTDVYANMKPKQAAALFEEMDPDFAAGFLARMRPDAAASIMAGLTPQAAYTISVVLAGRNAEVPKE